MSGTCPSEGAVTASRLEMTDISKRFGGLQAVDRVTISLQGGEVLALCGANGAGKSTLVRILAGVEHADSGQIALDGVPVVIDRPQTAAHHGLSFVHQELNLVPKFTGLQNMAMGADRQSRLGLVATKRLRRLATEVQERLGYRIPLDVPVDRLSVSDRWMVSLGRCLMRSAKFVALDEPTASFTDGEAEKLYKVIKELTASGVGILYISHRLEEVLEVADRVTVLRNGSVVGSYETAELTVSSLTKSIVGHEVEALTHRPGDASTGAPIRLSVRGLRRPPNVVGASFDLRRGEIVGVAGLVGSGRTELARLLIGADQAAGGEITLDGKPYAPRGPHDAIRAGVVLVPEERRSQALLLSESIERNLDVASHGSARHLMSRFRPRRSHRAAVDIVDELGIKTDGVTRPVLSLSGGNQQKVVVGNYLRTRPSVLVLDEPTVGVDVGSREEIYGIITGLAGAGASILVISSDFDELAVCDRVLVMRHGAIVAEVPSHRATKGNLTRLCFEAEQPAA
ncbi:sugar ABC transporter ATP-binding protein [Streptomyces sp. SYSU K217416]